MLLTIINDDNDDFGYSGVCQCSNFSKSSLQIIIAATVKLPDILAQS